MQIRKVIVHFWIKLLRSRKKKMSDEFGFAVMVKTDCPHINEHINLDLIDNSLLEKKRKYKIIRKKN